MYRDRIALSKTISHALRHKPEEYGLQPDSEGWVSISDLVAALGIRRPSWRTLQEEDLVQLNETAEKRRFEIVAGRIRALYGHSTPRPIERTPEEPPEVLFHGTNERSLAAIQREGLHPMRRQHVHLSIDRQTALVVGRRKGGRTVILEIDSRGASEAGIPFCPPLQRRT